MTVLCLKMGPKDLINLARHLSPMKLPMPGSWDNLVSCMEWPSEVGPGTLIMKLLKMGDSLPEAMLVAVRGFLDVKGDVKKFQEACVLTDQT